MAINLEEDKEKTEITGTDTDGFSEDIDSVESETTDDKNTDAAIDNDQLSSPISLRGAMLGSTVNGTSSISGNIDKIRYAIYGEEVREAIAASIEQFNTKIEGTVQKTEMNEALAGKVAVDQGSGNAGKALIVGDDGSVTLGEAGVPEAVATALLDCLMHVAWIDDRGPALVQALEDALGRDIEPVVPIDTIVVNYVKTVSPAAGDSADVLRTQITVTAYYADGTSEQVTGYTLLPNALAAGENTIRVRFRGVEKPLWLYVPSGTNDHCIFSIPAGTDIYSKEGLSTGILLNDVNKSYTVLFKGTDESTEPTAANQRIAFSSTTTLLNKTAGVKGFIRYVDAMKYYIISHNGTNANFDRVSNEVASQHEVCYAVRQSIANNKLTRMAAVFVDGVEVDKISDSNLDASGYIHDNPIVISNTASMANITGKFTWVGHVSVFRIYDTALTDTEINAILGVTI